MRPEPRLDPRRLLLESYAAAIRSVDGRASVRTVLEAHPVAGDVQIFAVGKAAESMALGALDVLGGQCVGGLLVTKDGHLQSGRLEGLGIETLVAGHPVPTRASLLAGERLLGLASSVPSDTTPLFLVSGGTSSLVEVLTPGLALGDLQHLNDWLLASGLPIASVNLVRKSVSRIKGGRLLTHLAGKPPRVLAISDVPDDDPRVIGSGLLVPEPDLAERVRSLDLPDWLRHLVEDGLVERRVGSCTGPTIELVATLGHAKRAAAACAAAHGVKVTLHADILSGDAAETGRALALALGRGHAGLHIWGGETTVRLPPIAGRGGRNQHLALAAAFALAGRSDCFLLSAGTDGTDGPTQDAGALIDGYTLERTEFAGLDAKGCLDSADAGSALEASGDLIRVGPTGTNVMDLVIGLRL